MQRIIKYKSQNRPAKHAPTTKIPKAPFPVNLYVAPLPKIFLGVPLGAGILDTFTVSLLLVFVVFAATIPGVTLADPPAAFAVPLTWDVVPVLEDPGV
jgi:hypothetical protein